MTIRTGAQYAQQLDSQDSLAHFRERFVIDDPNLIYLDGNSLGRLPKQTVDLTQALVEHGWGKRLIRGWNDGWISLQEEIGAKLGQLLGAKANEIIIADSTSINLFKLTMAALQAQPGRTKIITDNLNFPSDLYILRGAARLAGPEYQVQVIESADGIHGPVEALKAAMDADTALVALTHTVFKSSFTYNMAELTASAHEAGALILWDMSHSAGSVPINLNETQADLGVGCTYKYINGGPGSPAFLYVHSNLQARLNNPITGWMGHRDMFNFALDYERDPGLRHFLSGTPPILSTATIEPGVDLLLEAEMDNLRAKSVQQSEYLIALWEALLAPLGFSLNSPKDAAQRGSHISLGHPEGWRIAQALIDMQVIPDFRKPDNIRLGIAPLYTSFSDIHGAVIRLQKIVAERLYERYGQSEKLVT